MKPSTILITSSGVEKLVPEGMRIPEKPEEIEGKIPSGTAIKEARKKAYAAALTALEKEAIEFERQSQIDLWLPTYAFNNYGKVPGIYKDVMIPEYKIITQYLNFDTPNKWVDTPDASLFRKGDSSVRQVIRFLPETASEPKKEPTHFEIAFQNLAKVLTLIGNKRDTTPGLGGIQILVKEAKEHLELLLSEIQSFEKGKLVGDPAVKEETQEELWKEARQLIEDLNIKDLLSQYTISRK